MDDRPYMTKKIIQSVLTTALGVLATGCSGSSPPMTCEAWGSPEQLATRPSPFDSAMARVDSVELKICYSRPSARGRVIFGGLVPYDTLWRTGANEATILHLSTDADIAGIPLDAGKYSLYTVPDPEQWTVVVNETTGQWGLTRDERGAQGNLFPNAYTEEVRARELGRRPVDVVSIPHTERLTAAFSRVEDRQVDLHIDWATTRIIIPIRLSASRER